MWPGACLITCICVSDRRLHFLWRAGGPAGEKALSDLRLRVTEHNVLVVAKYYSRVTTGRLAELLDLPAAEVGGWFTMAGSPLQGSTERHKLLHCLWAPPDRFDLLGTLCMLGLQPLRDGLVMVRDCG